jgi:cysteine desulfurase/selenocysteine lyase
LESHRRAGIVTFKFAGIDSAWLYKQLMSKDVVCANRGGGVRFSPHFHTTTACMEGAIEVLKTLIT